LFDLDAQPRPGQARYERGNHKTDRRRREVDEPLAIFEQHAHSTGFDDRSVGLSTPRNMRSATALRLSAEGVIAAFFNPTAISSELEEQLARKGGHRIGNPPKRTGNQFQVRIRERRRI
jgi:hypothetical protein